MRRAVWRPFAAYSTLSPARRGHMTATISQRGNDFAELFRQVKAAGLLGRRPGYYAVKIALTALAFVGGWVAFGLLGNSWWQLAVAAFLGIVFTQIGFLGHDAGHRQIFRSRWANDLTGLLHGNLLIGLSFGWWVNKHNAHHGHPNQVGKDPDIGAGAVLFTQDQARGRRGVLSRFVGRYQAFLFFPMLLLEGLNLHVASVQALKARPAKNRPWEAALLLLHLGGYLTAVFLVLTWAGGGLHRRPAGPLRALHGPGVRAEPQGHADARGGREARLPARPGAHRPQRPRRAGHRLRARRAELPDRASPVPSMPRPNLRRVQPMVAAFCAHKSVQYTETSLIDSYRQALGHLHRVGDPLRS